MKEVYFYWIAEMENVGYDRVVYEPTGNNYPSDNFDTLEDALNHWEKIKIKFHP